MMSRARYVKKDGNHNAIVSALEQIGVGVLDTSSAGDGWSDLVTFYRGVMRAVEIKDSAQDVTHRKLTIAQVRAHDLARAHGCRIHIVESVDEALRLHGARV